MQWAERGMRAAYVTELGPPSAIMVGDVPTPVVGPSGVLVAVDTVAVNPVDTLIRSGAYWTTLPMPFVVGRDLTGRVVTTGSDVTGFAPGEWVWVNSMGHDRRQGAFAEYAPVPTAATVCQPQWTRRRWLPWRIPPRPRG